MTPEQLKASILQYAIQGKLVEQRPEEGTAEDLYSHIQEERKRLIKEKIIKKGKRLLECAQDIDIPNSWKLCKLGDCIDLLSGQDLTSDRYNANGEGIVYLTGASNIGNDGSIIINRWTTSPTSVAHKGNLLLTCKGTIGKTCILDIDEAHIARQFMAIKEILIDINYLRYFIEISIKKLQRNAKSMIPGIDRDSVRELDFPLPPLAEQYRIVAKIEELMPFVERYAASYEELEKLNAKFPEDMKKAILQYAIQGKLVEQRPEEGTAEELYQQIREERKKSPKPKGLTSITEDEILFDIPETWRWVKLGEIASVIRGLTFSKSSKAKLEATSLVFRGGNIDSKTEKLNYNDNIYVDTAIIKDEQFLKKGDTLIVSSSGTNSSIGKSCYIDKQLTNISFGGFMMVVRPSEKVDAEYISIQIKLYRKKIIAQTAGYIGNITNPILNNIMVPLPPLAEQKRIVQKINQLLTYCHQLIK